MLEERIVTHFFLFRLQGFGLGIATYGPYVMVYWALYEKFKALSAYTLNKYSSRTYTNTRLPMPVNLSE